MEKKLRLGVIGTGLAWQRLHWPALETLQDKFEIAAVCNRTVSKAAGVASELGLAPENVYSDYHQMLAREDIDAFDLLVPIDQNFEIASEIISSGRHLIAEKPFTSKPEEAKTLIKLKNEKNVKVMVAENFRYDQENLMMKALIDEGAIGQVMYFVQNVPGDFEAEAAKGSYAATPWRQDPNFDGGSFLDACVHDMARMRMLFGEAESLTALARPWIEEYSPFMCISALMRFKNSVVGHFAYNPRVKELSVPPLGLRIFGTEGEVYLESKDCGVLRVYKNGAPADERAFTPNYGYRGQFENFYDAMMGNAAIESTPEQEVGDIELIFAILRSAREGAIVTL